MNVDGKPYRTIWLADDGWGVEIIDQTKLPFTFEVIRLEDCAAAATAIRDMWVRGAPLIGTTASYGMALAMREDWSDENVTASAQALMATRPTAVNLRWAVDAMQALLLPLAPNAREQAAYIRAVELCDEDVAICSSIGDHGLSLIHNVWEARGKPDRVNVLTHCNAGWLATVDWGTALAPIYKAHDAGIPVHVWVDETRPRNQGASLTAWELGKHGVAHTVIVDNVGGHLMQHGMVDMCITGTDRTTAAGDVCNKIGTYLKALAAHDNGVPFYVGLPGPTIDWTIDDGGARHPDRTARYGGSDAHDRSDGRRRCGDGRDRACGQRCSEFRVRCYACPTCDWIDYRTRRVQRIKRRSGRALSGTGRLIRQR